MLRLRIYRPVFTALLILIAAISAHAADELRIVYDPGTAPLMFEDAASRPAGLLPDLWRWWAQKTGRKVEFTDLGI